MNQQTRFLRITQVSEIVALSRSTIYAKLKAGEFPAPKQISARCVRWTSSSINEWIERQAGSA